MYLLRIRGFKILVDFSSWVLNEILFGYEIGIILRISCRKCFSCWGSRSSEGYVGCCWVIYGCRLDIFVGVFFDIVGVVNGSWYSFYRRVGLFLIDYNVVVYNYWYDI